MKMLQRSQGYLLVGLALTAGAPAWAQEKLPPNVQVIRLETHPTAIDLKNPFEYSQLLVTGQLSSGEKIDVTRMAQIEAPAAVAKVSPTGLVRPVADGAGDLRITLAGQSATVPVKVAGQK